MRSPVAAAIATTILLGSACATTPAAHPASIPSSPTVLESRRGLASFYGPGFDQRLAASGVRFDMHALVAAHPTYPFGTVVRVRNLRNGRTVNVEIVDRGPAKAPRSEGVIIDLSQRAASVIRMLEDGRAPVRVDVLRWGN